MNYCQFKNFYYIKLCNINLHRTKKVIIEEIFQQGAIFIFFFLYLSACIYVNTKQSSRINIMYMYNIHAVMQVKKCLLRKQVKLTINYRVLHLSAMGTNVIVKKISNDGSKKRDF